MKNIILDTDIGPDCDDAGALALLNLYADSGLCRILGVGHCPVLRREYALTDEVIDFEIRIIPELK